MQTTTLIATIIWASFILGSHAWGPITHLYLCSLVAERYENGTSTTTTAVHSFLTGCNSPDSLKHVWPELHSLEFAAHLFEHAVHHHKQYTIVHNSTTTDLVEFSLGFGCHIASDEVGHHKNGFLTPSSVDHEVEFNVDSMIFHEREEDRFDSTTAKGVMSEDATDLILNTATSYHMFNVDGHTSAAATAMTRRYLRAKTKTPIAINRARIQSAINRFQAITSAEHLLVRIQPRSVYKFELKRNSFCNVSNYQDVASNFNISAEWAISTCALWRSTMMTLLIKSDDTNKRKSEEFRDDAAEAIHRAVNDMFSANHGTSCPVSI